MGRLLVALTALIGGVGLGLALGYVVLVVAAFLPGAGRIVEFLVGTEDGTPRFGFLLVLIPYALLLAHLWLRLRVAGILLQRGEVEQAKRFATRRLSVNPLRAKREVLANRVVLMRIALRELDYDRAVEIAGEALLPGGRASVDTVAFHRWRLEAILRRENLVEAKQLVGAVWPFAVRGEQAAAFCACAAELAVRNGDRDAFEEWCERAEYAQPGSPRLTIARAFAAVKFGATGEEAAAAADDLDGPLDWLREVPGAHGEVVAARAALLARAAHPDAALDLLSGARPADDARSMAVIDRHAAEVSELRDRPHST